MLHFPYADKLSVVKKRITIQIKKKFITQNNKNISIKICETQQNTKENFIAQKGNRNGSEYFYAAFK